MTDERTFNRLTGVAYIVLAAVAAYLTWSL